MIKGSFKDRKGEKYVTNEGYTVEIIECFSAVNMSIRFESGIILYNLEFGDIKDGSIKNPYHKSVCGRGYHGVGEYNSCVEKKLYKMWRGVINRCYNKKLQEKTPAYRGVTVCEEWCNFQNFAKWYYENWKPHMEGWHLDKDILVKGNKIYSPENCCFVPVEINSLFKTYKSDSTRLHGVRKNGKKYFSMMSNKYQGTYLTIQEAYRATKYSKEAYIKEMAEKWKGLISDQVYQTMCNYKYEIND
jgi:hypothetical protein